MSKNTPTCPHTDPADHRSADGTVIRCPCAFAIDMSLVDHSDGKILTPLQVPSHSELSSGNTQNQDFVQFRIEIIENPVERLSLEITQGTGSSQQQVYSESLDSMHEVGVHDWAWDGYNNSGVLDTKILKDPTLKLTLSAVLCGATKTKILQFSNRHAEQDWVDVSINKGSKTVQVELRVNLTDGGQHGVGELPPAEIWNHPVYRNTPANDPSRLAHTRIRSFDDLKALTLSGLKSYWSRSSNGLNISSPRGDHTVDVLPVVATEKAMDDIGLEYNTNADWGRSSNPGSIRGFFSFIANIFISEHAIYNAGWIKYTDGWNYQNPAHEDNAFSETAAHEIGHEILSAYGGEDYSYGHRGSSTVITQSTLSLTDGGESYPSSGEIDLMKYYNGSRPRDFYSRVVASMTDVKSLLWLARVRFNA